MGIHAASQASRRHAQLRLMRQHKAYWCINILILPISLYPHLWHDTVTCTSADPRSNDRVNHSLACTQLHAVTACLSVASPADTGIIHHLNLEAVGVAVHNFTHYSASW